MANDSPAQVETKYFEKLNISVLTINEIKELIKTDIQNTIFSWDKGRDVLKQCFHIIGPAGIGKTQICHQMSKELEEILHKKFDIIMIKSPVLSKDDFIIPFPVKDKDGEISSYKMLYSDFIPRDPDSYGLFVIDEFARGDHQLQQLLWQIQDEYAVHTLPFPKGWFVITIDNPDDSEYSMDLLDDAAGLRRQLHVYIEVSARDFLVHAIKENYHPLIIEFIQSHPDYVYDFKSQKLGAVYSNPASYEKLSDHLWKFDLNGEILLQLKKIESLAAGLINVNKTQLFIDFIKDKEKQIQPKDIFFEYDKVRKRVLKLVKDGENTKLSSIMDGFCTYLSTSMPKYKNVEILNVANFIVDMPIDMAAVFTTFVDSLNRESKAFEYFIEINGILVQKSEKYRTEFYEPIVAFAAGKDAKNE